MSTPSHRHTSVGRPARTYLQQLCTDTGYSLEELSEAMDDRDGWQDRERELRKSMQVAQDNIYKIIILFYIHVCAW